MRWSNEQFNEYQQRRQAGSKASRSKLERPAGDEPLEAPQAQAGHPGKFFVRVTSFRRRLLDEDNLAAKYHVDCCRYAGILPADSPDKAHISVGQIKVNRKEDEKTVIEITPI